MNKLAAFILFTSQGIPLFHQGQEWGHSKIIAETKVPDLNVHKMDPNSYNKDNETNWVNWNELSQNQDLVNFYKALIQIRKEYPQLRKTRPQDISFYNFKNEFSLGYLNEKTQLKNDYFLKIMASNYYLDIETNKNKSARLDLNLSLIHIDAADD